MDRRDFLKKAAAAGAAAALVPQVASAVDPADIPPRLTLAQANKAEWWMLWRNYVHNVCFQGTYFYEQYPEDVQQRVEKYVDSFNWAADHIWNSAEEAQYYLDYFGIPTRYNGLHANRPRFRFLLTFLGKQATILNKEKGHLLVRHIRCLYGSGRNKQEIRIFSQRGLQPLYAGTPRPGVQA